MSLEENKNTLHPTQPFDRRRASKRQEAQSGMAMETISGLLPEQKSTIPAKPKTTRISICEQPLPPIPEGEYQGMDDVYIRHTYDSINYDKMKLSTPAQVQDTHDHPPQAEHQGTEAGWSRVSPYIAEYAGSRVTEYTTGDSHR